MKTKKELLIKRAPKLLLAIKRQINYLGDDAYHYEDIGDLDALKSVQDQIDYLQSVIKGL